MCSNTKCQGEILCKSIDIWDKLFLLKRDFKIYSIFCQTQLYEAAHYWELGFPSATNDVFVADRFFFLKEKRNYLQLSHAD